MRRASFTPVFNVTNQEPLIVVEESNVEHEDEPKEPKKSNSDSSDSESPVNPYLLSPFPDLQQRRKHSLPSLQITEGITASQVRRLSEAGSEASGVSPKEMEFLATLSQKTIPASGGRRHSVVTISPCPTSLFGRNRRESIAGLPPSSRRGSGVAGPPLTEHRGSVHNLQLDIMDGIVQARKSRSGSGMWTAGNENKVQVQTSINCLKKGNAESFQSNKSSNSSASITHKTTDVEQLIILINNFLIIIVTIKEALNEQVSSQREFLRLIP